MKRRRLLHGAGLLVTGTLGGCADSEPPASTSSSTATEESSRLSTATGTETPRPTATERPTATSTDTRTTNTTAENSIYISEILANPEGPDVDAVSDESVLVEVNADTGQDLSGYTLAYGTRHEYVFPDRVSVVEPGASIELISGRGTDEVSHSARPTYTLFVGSDTPLLANDGMRLTLHDRAGTTVDSVTYGSMGEGVLYVRPET